MSCLNCSENSPTTYNRCQPQVSSNCVSYQGGNLECGNDTTFHICKGESMSDVQIAIFEKICSLSGDVDVTQVTIPACLIPAWDENDFTILNLFNLALEASCNIQAQVTELSGALDRNNPIISGLNFCCCSVDCNTSTAEIRLSDALTQIIECVCKARAEASVAKQTADDALYLTGSLQTQVTALQTNVNSLLTSRINILVDIAAIKTKTDCLPVCP